MARAVVLKLQNEYKLKLGILADLRPRSRENYIISLFFDNEVLLRNGDPDLENWRLGYIRNNHVSPVIYQNSIQRLVFINKRIDMIGRFYLTYLVIVLLVSCGQDSGKQALADREKALEKREQDLASIEEEYRTLLKMRDSLRARESTPLEGDTSSTHEPWPDSVLGEWNSRMVCRASRCANYVVGDQRHEVWRFYSDSVGSYVQVVNNDEHIRIFEGQQNGNEITLNILPDTNMTKSSVARRVQLDDVTSGIMKGTLVLTGKNNCETVFSVELTPRAK